jgi:hypothetical protein
VGAMPDMNLELYALKRQEKSFAQLAGLVRDTLLKHADPQVGATATPLGGSLRMCCAVLLCSIGVGSACLQYLCAGKPQPEFCSPGLYFAGGTCVRGSADSLQLSRPRHHP